MTERTGPEQLDVDWSELELALGDRSEAEFFFDRETGNVECLTPDVRHAQKRRDADALADWMKDAVRHASRIDADPERYVEVEPLPSSFGYRDMEAFAEQVDDDAARDALFAALRRRTPFRKFRRVLDRHGMTDTWYGFERKRMMRRVRNWLADRGVEPTNPPPVEW